MRLAEYPPGPDPPRVWQYAERYLGGGTRTYSRFAAELEISPRYHPQQGPPDFTVPTFRVPAGRHEWLTNTLDSPLRGLYRDRGELLLPVHPEALRFPGLPARDRLGPPGPPLRAVPSANARTVFVERLGGRPVPPHFVKLHYPRRLSRFTRRLRRPVIALQLWVADELATVGTPFLPEVAGGVVGEDATEAWGFLVRGAGVDAPVPAPGPLFTVPLFALYGHDLRAPTDPTVLEQLVRRSGEDAAGWVCTRLLRPLITMWCEVLLRTGCALEPHGQNVLFQFTVDGRETRVAYRDCAVYVDPVVRRERGLSRPLPPRNVISRDVPHPREHVFSLVYDSFLGSHALGYVARLVERRFGVPPPVLHSFAREVFAGTGAAGLLPPTVYYYDDRLHPDGGWRLVDTGAPPLWR